MTASTIEWTEHTWNPIVGCSVLTAGCINCYAMMMAARLERMGQERYAGTTKKVNGSIVWTGKLALAPTETLLAPMKRRKPTTWFVNSMGDLFHKDCPDAWIDRVFAVMLLTPWHTYQVLTKRADRMQAYCGSNETIGRVLSIANEWAHGAGTTETHHIADGLSGFQLANVWLGVSAERQQEADERIPLLLQTPAAIRFVSCEPLLGPIDLTRIAAPKDPTEPEAEWLMDALAIGDMYEQRTENMIGELRYDTSDGPYRETRIDWVIAGGESGPRARPMHPDWARGLRDQCDAAGVPFFFKQWGEWAPYWFQDDGEPKRTHDFGDAKVFRIGKANTGGGILDNREHKAFPEARACRR